MRVLIVTAGSRGDVAPFTGLGQRLEQAGHRVAIAAHSRFGDLADAMRSCVDDAAYRNRAVELAARIRAEDGAAAVLTVINGRDQIV